MHTHNGTVYRMLGVGAFMTMFWTGVAADYELGLGFALLLIMGLVSGCIATVGVCAVAFQRRDGQGLFVSARGREPQRSRPAAQPAAAQPLRPVGRGSKPAGLRGPGERRNRRRPSDAAADRRASRTPNKSRKS